jgi:hypothetical protein
MSQYSNLAFLVGRAGLDKTLRSRLLNGDRSRAIAAYELSEEEREAVLSIQANTLVDFAEALLQWFTNQNGSQSFIDETRSPHAHL